MERGLSTLSKPKESRKQTHQARGHLLQCRFQSPSCKLKSISNESPSPRRTRGDERVETGKGGGKGLGKNGPFVSPNGSFGGGVT